MGAAFFDAIGKPLRIGKLEIPKPKADHILLKVCRCGICGSDLHMTAEPVFEIAKDDVFRHEFCGEVIEGGSDVEGLRTGDQVTVAPLRGCGDCESYRRGEAAWCMNMALIGGSATRNMPPSRAGNAASCPGA
jgi:(R,R)-butanediol dehydrogenase/meso-butanediol dehydrogenase/diacetyl reductase